MKQAGKWIAVLFFFTAFAACGKEEADIPDQKTAFFNYLNNREMDTLEYNGVFRHFFDNEEDIREAATGVIDSGRVARWLGEKVAGNPLAGNADPDSLAAWGTRLKALGTRVSSLADELLGERPALDYGMLVLGQAGDSLADYGDTLRLRASMLSSDPERLQILSGNITARGEWLREIGGLMDEIPFTAPGTINAGDSVYFYYTGYIFTGSEPAEGEWFTSNVIPIHHVPGWNNWGPLLPEPMGIKAGDGNTIAGIDRGVQGDIKTNYFQIFLTSDLAYGDSGIGIIDGATPVVFQIDVVRVVKQ